MVVAVVVSVAVAVVAVVAVVVAVAVAVALALTFPIKPLGKLTIVGIENVGICSEKSIVAIKHATPS